MSEVIKVPHRNLVVSACRETNKNCHTSTSCLESKMTLRCPVVDIFIFVEICYVHHDTDVTDVAKKSCWTVDFLESRGLQGAFGSGIRQVCDFLEGHI